MRKADAKEIYAASLILLIGIIYLAAQADALFSMGSTTVKGDIIQLSKNEILSHSRSVLTIVLCFSGGILLLKARTAGWIISLSILLLLITISSGIFLSNITGLNVSGIVLIVGISLLLLAIIFLVQARARQKFSVTKKSYLSVFVLFVVLVFFYFVLQ
ncbi:MAG TPA: hypothetical protein VKA49_10305 [Flavitalea sp.]|nr:hypothetical protein [Flavitalea sp.]